MTNTDKLYEKPYKQPLYGKSYINTDKLKRLAESIVNGGPNASIRFYGQDAYDILAMIAENERLKLEKRNMQAAFNDTVGECDKLSTERDEAVALLRETHKAYGEWTGKTCKQERADTANAAFLARIDASK